MNRMELLDAALDRVGKDCAWWQPGINRCSRTSTRADAMGYCAWHKGRSVAAETDADIHDDPGDMEPPEEPEEEQPYTGDVTDAAGETPLQATVAPSGAFGEPTPSQCPPDADEEPEGEPEPAPVEPVTVEPVRSGAKGGRPSYDWTDEADETIRAMVADGSSDVEIAAVLGVTKTAAAIRRKALGIMRPKGGRAPKESHTAAIESRDADIEDGNLTRRIRELRGQGMPVAQVAHELGTTQYVVHGAMMLAGDDRKAPKKLDLKEQRERSNSWRKNAPKDVACRD